MKKIKNNITGAILMLVMITGVFSSCNEEPVLQLPYMFRPINFNVELNKTVATITWSKVDSAVNYTLQMSSDSVDYSNPLIDTTFNGLSFTKELAGDTKFYARVRANASDTAKSSKFNSTLGFKTPKENIFQGFGISNNTGTLYSAYMTDVKTLTIKWTPGANVTHLILNNADETTRDSVVISSTEAVAGEKVVSDRANSNWKVRIYNGKILRGTTYGIVEGDIILNAGEDLPTALNNAPAGSVILLPKGVLFQTGSSTYRLSKNIKVRGLSVTNRAVLSMTAGTPTTTSGMLGFVDASSMDYVKFENIDFSGYCDNNTAATKIGYLFNNNLMTTVKHLSFTNCNIHNFGNTPLRVQAAKNQVIDSVSFVGCTIFDIGFSSTYAIVNSNSADFINTINFSYCTIYNFKGSLVLRQNQTLNSITVSNCTINQGMQDTGSSRFLIDCNNAVIGAKGITIRNCIFGSTAANAAGVRTSGTKTVASSYFTTDYTDNTLVGGIDYSLKSLMTAYSGASTDLWMNPVGGDFTFKATGFAGKGTSGDPRWW